jgi:hypothetical protein
MLIVAIPSRLQPIWFKDGTEDQENTEEDCQGCKDKLPKPVRVEHVILQERSRSQRNSSQPQKDYNGTEKWPAGIEREHFIDNLAQNS